MAGTRQATWLGDASCRIVGLLEQTVSDGVVVEASQGGHQVFGRRSAAAGVSPDGDVLPGALRELLDLQWRGFVETPFAPDEAYTIPVAPVQAARSGRDGCGHAVDVV